MEFERHLTRFLAKNTNLLGKMVFVTGPRQIGKTTLLQGWPKALHVASSHYLNWDIPEDRKILRGQDLSYFRAQVESRPDKPLFLFDEIHKFPRWKNFLKGLYDALKDRASFAVTGSARLDIYRRGGDSLMGRYWLFHLLPITIAEAMGTSQLELPSQWVDTNRSDVWDGYRHLYTMGGFPEPFFSLDEAGLKRWMLLHREVLVRSELRDLSRIVELSGVENLLELLPSKIGSPLSLNSLREDLEVSHPTIQNWLRWLESLYYYFSVPVYSKKLVRSLKKEKKIYLYNWAEVANEGARFENFVALHLLKGVLSYREMNGDPLSLYYLRDKEKREVDFLMVRDGTPWMLVEAKMSPDDKPSTLLSYGDKLKVRHLIQLTHRPVDPQWKYFRDKRYWLSPAATFFSNWV